MPYWKRDPAGIRTQGPQLRRLLLYPAELQDHTLFLCLTKGQKNAERKGFEPLEVVSLNGFQDRRNRPLCHLSESKPVDVNLPIWGAKVLPTFVLCKFFD